MFQMHFARRTAISWARSRDLTPQRIWPVLRERGGLEAILSTPEGELAERLGSGARARAVLAGPEDPAAERWTASAEAAGLRVVTAVHPAYPGSAAAATAPATAESDRRTRSPRLGVSSGRLAASPELPDPKPHHRRPRGRRGRGRGFAAERISHHGAPRLRLRARRLRGSRQRLLGDLD